MARSGSVRRRQAGVLLVGATEPEVGSWLHADGHATRAVAGADAALAALGEEPADLVIADREPDGMDVAGVCLALREDPRLGSAWLLAVTAPVRGGSPTSAPTTTCTGRSRACSCSPARARACAPCTSAPTTRCCAR